MNYKHTITYSTKERATQAESKLKTLNIPAQETHLFYDKIMHWCLEFQTDEQLDPGTREFLVEKFQAGATSLTFNMPDVGPPLTYKHTLTFSTSQQTEAARNWLLAPSEHIFVQVWTEGLALCFTTQDVLDKDTRTMIREKTQPLDYTFNAENDEEDMPDPVGEIYRKVEWPHEEDDEPRDETREDDFSGADNV
jgi:hypothetical protein